MTASIIHYPGLKEEATTPDGETLREQYWDRNTLQRQIEDVLRVPKSRAILEEVLHSLSDGVRRESVKLPKHSCILNQIHFAELAAVAGSNRDEPLEGHFLRWQSAYLLPRVEAVHQVSKIMRLYVLPDPQKHNFLAMQFERAAVRNMRFLESGKIPEGCRTEALLEIKEQLDFVEPMAKGKDRSIFRRFRQWCKGGDQ
jgi:hypothetical protein